MKLLLTQKNSFFEIIEQRGFFSPNNFELVDIANNWPKTEVRLKNSDFQFVMDQRDYASSLIVIMSPSENQIQDIIGPVDWRDCLNLFDDWQYYLHREVGAPNLWERFKSTTNNLHLSNEFDNSKFSHQEYKALSLKMNHLIEAIPSISLLENQTLAIQQQLESLLEKTEMLGKFDWRNLFVGTIVSIIIQLNITPDNANALWGLIRNIFSMYFIE